MKKEILRIGNSNNNKNQTYFSNIFRHVFNSKKNEQTIGIKYKLHFKIKLSDLDVSKITDMSKLFENFDFEGNNCDDVDISNWDVSNVTNMSSMFYKSKGFNQNLSSWNVSNVNNMSYMFYNCNIFNQNLTNWSDKLTNITLMKYMFAGCESFDSDLTWNIENIKNIDLLLIFDYCKKIIEINKKDKTMSKFMLNKKINITYNIINNKNIRRKKLVSPYGNEENLIYAEKKLLSKDLIIKGISLNYIDCYYNWYKSNSNSNSFNLFSCKKIKTF